MKRNRSRIRGGYTLIEGLTASVIGTLVVFGVLSTLIMGMSGWARGQGQINAESSGQRGMRAIVAELREAMAVTVDADGKGLTYQLPARDGAGNFSSPPVWDGVSRRIQLGTESNGRAPLMIGPTASLRQMAADIRVQDPNTSASYRFFTSPATSVVRQVDIRLISESLANQDKRVRSETRELIFLRNIPTTTQ